jgi:D-xylose transport system permease protein
MENVMELQKTEPSPQRSRLVSLLASIDWRKYRSVVVLAALAIFLAIKTDGDFVSARNLTNLTKQVAINGILAVGMTYVILLGGIDLSVGSVVALAGIVTGVLQVNYGLSAWTGTSALWGAVLTALAATLVGTLCGAFNGWWITRFKIAPFIITLGMMVIARGLSLIFSNGAAISPLGEAFNGLGQGYLPPLVSVAIVGGAGLLLVGQRLFQSQRKTGKDIAFMVSVLAMSAAGVWVFYSYRGLPLPALIFGILGLAGLLVLERTRLGRFVLASGGNPEAAWLAGVPIRKITFGIYIMMGALAGLCGAILSARLNGALPTAGELFELDAIAAVVIGGTSLMGGVGTVQGAILGAFFIGSLNNGMSLLEITEFYQKVIKGVIIILAVWFDTRQAGQQKQSH